MNQKQALEWEAWEAFTNHLVRCQDACATALVSMRANLWSMKGALFDWCPKARVLRARWMKTRTALETKR